MPISLILFVKIIHEIMFQILHMVDILLDIIFQIFKTSFFNTFLTIKI